MSAMCMRNWEEMPMLLQGAETVREWGRLRVSQLLMCGMRVDAAIERAVKEADDGCLGHVVRHT